MPTTQPNPSSDDSSTGVFKQRLTHVALDFLVAHFGKVLSFAGGVLSAYLAIWTQIGEAKHAASDAASTAVELKRDVRELRGELRNLVTENELNAARDRIATLEDRLNYARDQAGTAPVARRKHREETRP